ncbi:hypothetical protein BFP97_08920 [Roseivirga sp. 4D4]|nr:hypothetical protein BFP97_08920 [Roseivirga sp. 4D4]
MKRYLEGLKVGFERNGISYEVIEPKLKTLVGKYYHYPRLALNYGKRGQHIIISERYAYLLPFLKNRATVICHDLHTLYPEARTPLVHKLLYKVFLKLMLKADKVVCVSNHTKSDLERFLGNVRRPDRLTVVHNGIEDFWLRPAKLKREQVEWSPKLKDKIVLASVGTDAWYKNNSWSIDLLGKLGDGYTMLRVGDFSRENEKLIDQLGLRNRIVSVENISDEELKLVYSSAEYLLFPSLTEGFGWPALEAALSNCTVISDHRTAMQEIFKNTEDLISLDQAEELIRKNEVRHASPKYFLWQEQVKKILN